MKTGFDEVCYFWYVTNHTSWHSVAFGMFTTGTQCAVRVLLKAISYVCTVHGYASLIYTIHIAPVLYMYSLLLLLLLLLCTARFNHSINKMGRKIQCRVLQQFMRHIPEAIPHLPPLPGKWSPSRVDGRHGFWYFNWLTVSVFESLFNSCTSMFVSKLEIILSSRSKPARTSYIKCSKMFECIIQLAGT